MLQACDNESDKALTEGEIIVNSVGLIFAGYETTSSALAFTTGLLAAHPDIQEQLAEEIRNFFAENPVSNPNTIILTSSSFLLHFQFL